MTQDLVAKTQELAKLSKDTVHVQQQTANLAAKLEEEQEVVPL